MFVHEQECEAAGLNVRAIEKVAREFDIAGRHAKKLGIYVFGGSGTGTLRIHLDDGKTALILANLDGCYYDGGDGGCRPDEDGLLRGE